MLNVNKLYFFIKKNKFYLSIIIIISLILRFLFINQRSIWHDEGYTALMIKFPFWEIIQRTMLDVHPPLYYLLLHYWAQIFGNSEIALRGFSAILGAVVVVLTYFFIKKLFNKNIAITAALFTSIGPFLIRYSQEARMWELVALFITAASFFLIKAIEQLNNKETKKQKKWWILYSISLILAAYTQYFSLLILPVHWLYVLLRKKIFSLGWWLSNISIIVIFCFWIPIFLTQTSRVSSGYWIQKSWITIRTVPGTIYRFLSYVNLDYIDFGNLGRFYVPNYIHSIVLVLLVFIAIFVFLKNKEKWKEIIFIFSYFLIPTYIVFFYSLINTPIYQDRYFVWCAVGFHSFLALFVCSLKKKLQLFFTSLIIILSIFGIFRVYTTETHGMREIGQFIQNNFQEEEWIKGEEGKEEGGGGDEIIAGELYVYFDFIYYNKTGQITKLLANPENIKKGFGEASLIYDNVDLIVKENLNELKPINNRVWLVGKPLGDYYKKIPSNWQELKHFEKEDSSVKLYYIKNY